ncbi:MAG TPA: hypothetical protein IGS40_07755 [Trichormus sp. M33_DOE_039]|nr:hypothetical protein [Trichormus sp. M33_DOE_039]
MKNELFAKIEEFYVQVQLGKYDHPCDLAIILQSLSDAAWDEVDELYPQSMIP